MAVRQTLQSRPWIGFTVVIVLVVVAVFLLISRNGGAGDTTRALNRAWFTIDDGKTWFDDDAAKVPPFSHEGKDAVRCYLFSCDGGKTKFVGYLERMPAELKKKIEGRTALDPMAAVASVEVKKPGDSTWLPRNGPKAAPIIDVKCPDGKTPEPVYP